MRHIVESLTPNYVRAAVFSALAVFNAGRFANAQVQPQTTPACTPVTPMELTRISSLPAERISCIQPSDLTRNLSIAAVNMLPQASIRHLNTAQLVALHTQFDGQITDIFWDTLTNDQAINLPPAIKEIVAAARQRRLAEALTHCRDQSREQTQIVFDLGNNYYAQGRYMDAARIFQELYLCRPEVNQLAFNVAKSLIEALGAVGIVRAVSGRTLDRHNDVHLGQIGVLDGLFDIQVTRQGTLLNFHRNISSMFSGLMQLRPVNVISVAELSALIDQLTQAKDQLTRLLQGPRPIPGLTDNVVLTSENSVAIITYILPLLRRIRDANTTPANSQTGNDSSTIATGHRTTPPLTPPPSTGRQNTRTVTSSPWPTVGMATGALAAGATAVAFTVMSVNAGGASDDAFANCVRLGLNQDCPTRATIGNERDVSQRNAGLAVGAGVVAAGLTVGAVLLRPRTTTVQITGIGAHADNTSVGVSVSGTFSGL